MAKSPSALQIVTGHVQPEAKAPIGADTDIKSQVEGFKADGDEDDRSDTSIKRLKEITDHDGNLIDLLGMGQLASIAQRAITEWRADEGTRTTWMDVTERGLNIAAQEYDQGEGARNYPFEGAADIHYPLITTAVQQFVGRASPELVRGDKACEIKAFSPPPKPSASSIQALTQPPPPIPSQDPQQAQLQQQQAQQQQLQQAQQASQQTQTDNLTALADDEREAKAHRIAYYINWLLFYGQGGGECDGSWEDDNDALLTEYSICGSGFKKVYPTATHPCSEFVSATRLCVSADTKRLNRCPRITQDFDAYPYEIDEAMRSGKYRDVSFEEDGSDPQAPRQMIEQHRMEDLDGDGFSEPYIVTIDVKSSELLRVEAAFTSDDVTIDAKTGKVVSIKRWLPYAPFRFLPHPKGNFYGIGLAQLLDQITASIDTSINQLTDAGNAEIAGGGFIASNVRLPNAGQAGDVWISPGEYQPVDIPSGDLSSSIWERTVPHPSAVTFQLLEFLLSAAKDVAAVKDVLMGETPATAPVGTTFAIQGQALQVYSAIFKRFWRGLQTEFRLIRDVLKRFPTDTDIQKYQELTGGDLIQDMQGDEADLQPIANPEVVTKIQKTSRLASTLQLAESPIGLAAGMTQPGPAKELVKEALQLLDWDRPDRFIADVQPNQLQVAELQAKIGEMQAATQLKTAQAQGQVAGASLDRAKTLREMGLAAEDTHHLHQEADRIHKEGSVAPLPDPDEDRPGQPAAGTGP